MPDSAQVDADLVSPACLDRDARERQRATQVLGANDPRDRFAAAPCTRRHFLAVHRVAANRRVDPPSGLHFAPDEGVVLLFDFAVSKLAGGLLVRPVVLRDDPQASGTAVETKDDSAAALPA